MTAEQYERMVAPLRARAGGAELLSDVNRALTYLGYVAYPLLLVVLLFRSDLALLVRCVLVPGVAFAAITLFRAWCNAPRPYEVLAIDPLIKKDTGGKSFPSRHTFSMFMIAFAWLAAEPLLGILLLLGACVLAVVRVLGGVHFPRDVVAGALLALAFYIIGFVLIP
ncbi:phosphatase PAP2 family protein [Curtanaerobium respiraculi]|uniref:phosphatase PAP2 family protein n=1 Tax=Curtanaerobium respiraculi TaxID=2949669 RepID=UPI0024B31F76|nr:phosphatase PAP2 family protein [Curtanaerobium respiraculi]